jgi:predicted cobalt transporter CbtA
MALSLQLGRRLTRRFGVWNSSLLAAFIFVLLTTTFCGFLPTIDEVPPAFPAGLLWKFRLAAWGTQLMLWSTLGLLFGWLTEREQRARLLGQ